MLDGEHLADTCVIVALAITADGQKFPVGLWDGASENNTVVTAMLADLVSRGLCGEDGLLVVMDGAKALAAAVHEVFGTKAAVQRCTLHKRRNVGDHLPDKEKAWVDAKLVQSFHHPDPQIGLKNARHLARPASDHLGERAFVDGPQSFRARPVKATTARVVPAQPARVANHSQ